MKKLLLIFTILFSQLVHAQDDKTVTLVVSGQGKTQEEARQNALRSAIEQAFGTFISSKTEILNDNLVKEEIVSVANGNVQKYEIITELQLPDNSWSNTLSTTVSINKLISYTESKGFEAELKGALFAINIKKDELYKQNEIKAVRNMSKTVKQIADKSFNWTISVKDPIKFTPSQYSSIRDEKNLWEVPLTIGIKTNKNFNSIPTIIYKTLNALDYNVKSEITETFSNFGTSKLTIKDGREVFPFTISIADKIQNCYILRSDSTVIELLELINYFNHSVLNFNIDNGVKVLSLDSIQINNMKYLDGEGGIGSNRWLVWENHQNTKLEIYDNFTIALAHWTLKTGGPPSREVFLHSVFNRQDYETSFNNLPYYSYSHMQNVDKFLRETRGKKSVSYYRKMSIVDYSVSQGDLEHLNLKGTAFNFLLDRKFVKSIPFSTYGPIISFNSVINNSNELINIRCSHILNLNELGLIKSYNISRKTE